jgi:hypothetical protein
MNFVTSLPMTSKRKDMIWWLIDPPRVHIL